MAGMFVSWKANPERDSGGGFPNGGFAVVMFFAKMIAVV